MKSKVINELRDSHGMSRADAEVAFESVIHSIKSVVEREGEVRAAPLGTFKRVHQAERVGRNPATGETIKIAGRDVTRFKASKA